MSNAGNDGPNSSKVASTDSSGSSAWDEAVRQFFATYGGATYWGGHLHCRLAHLYAVTFEEERMATLSRVREKLNEALFGDLTTGALFGRFRARCPTDLAEAVDRAIAVRNHLAHRYVWETRHLTGTSQGLGSLTAQLDADSEFLHAVCDRVREHEKAIYRARVGPDVDIDAFEAEWSNLGEAAPDPVRLPKPQELIVKAWIDASGEACPWIYLESESGEIWQLGDTGLSDSLRVAVDSTWNVVLEIQKHLPAFVTSRPGRKANPPVWRGPFDYDLVFSNGVALSIEKVPTPSDGPGRVTWCIKERK
ncbi:MAG TPA: hypothetical protein VGY54_26750 [Polyangiaceae bacterium]|jgi:hypothetical protein|nr:hypothetical protein [Polyangiaceae bacterium]